MFRFLHAADLHLDSPLRDLERYEGAPVDAIRSASRRALENLVKLALDERVRFVVIAGDVFDGDWPDVSTGLFFVKQMGRLREANIPVFLISGNHDAANRMSRSLPYPDNVHVFATDKAETRQLDDQGIAVHGQGYAQQKESRNLAAGYPAPVSSHFNLGLLHTALDGREGHERYAPCTVAELAARGYDYWALGHVHQRESIGNGRTLIEFPGNLQGRHIRETDAKGCLLVTVDASRKMTKEFRALDVFRWQLARVDCSQMDQVKDLQERIAAALGELVAVAEGRPLAVRVQLEGACPVHDELQAAGPALRDDIRSFVLGRGDERIWLEKVQLRTQPLRTEEVVGEDALSELSAVVAELDRDPVRLKELLGDSELKGLENKLPAELRSGEDAIALTEAAWNVQLLDRVRALLMQAARTREERG